MVTGCTATENEFTGIFAIEGTVTQCTARANGWNGIEVFESTVTGCNATDNEFNGIHAETYSTVRNCLAKGNDPAGKQAKPGEKLMDRGSLSQRLSNA
ncbi:MAG: right-handed parallel beta-helix repeat-containing protein [Proteobacteria bacterium]|nr:right-handed parallel beta-helix repeat-containing protein [Pseudomonadota bacterium]